MSAGLVRTSDLDHRNASAESTRDTLFEQLGNSVAIARNSEFSIALPDGQTDPTPNPLPDYGE